MKIKSILLIVATLFLLFSQSCMRFRIKDTDAIDAFKKKHITLKTQTLQLGKHSLHYVIAGSEDKPTLFFIHGSPGSWSAYERYLQDSVLLTKYRMVSVDRPGFGYSDFGNVLSFETQTAMLEELIAQLQNNQPLYIIGHSLGGPYAVKLASQQLPFLKTIVLLAASVSPEEEAPEKWRPVFKSFPLRYLLPGAFRPSNTELCAFKKEVAFIPDCLDKVTCSVVIVQGLKDPLVPPANAYYAQKHLIHASDVQLITFEEANHFIPWTKYEAIKKVLLSLP